MSCELAELIALFCVTELPEAFATRESYRTGELPDPKRRNLVNKCSRQLAARPPEPRDPLALTPRQRQIKLTPIEFGKMHAITCLLLLFPSVEIPITDSQAP